MQGHNCQASLGNDFHGQGATTEKAASLVTYHLASAGDKSQERVFFPI